MKRKKSHQTIIIEVTIDGTISPDMARWFEGMSVTSVDGSTIITGVLPDQQALYGLVNLLRDLGVTVRSIKMEPKEGGDELS